MAYQLTPELDQFVQSRVDSGMYASEEQIVRAAFELLAKREEMLAHIDEGIDDLKNGRYVEFTGPEDLPRFMDGIKLDARKK